MSGTGSEATAIAVGVAGWDYPDWNRRVYPPRPGRGFDRLAYLARFVDVVEINSTFYRPASPAVAARWVERVGPFPRFRFTAKAHRSLTHEVASDLDEAVAATLRGLEPLRRPGRLAALLLQFPQRFRPVADSFDLLQALHERLEGWPVVVEVRHRDWAAPRALDWFRRRGLGWCSVDQPQVDGSTVGPTDAATAAVAYLRLHGRNVRDWFRPDAGRDARYDYLYTDTELRSLAELAKRMAARADSVVVVQNNHFRGQAVVNALQMKHILSGRAVAAPESLVTAYPALGPIVRVGQQRMF